VPNDPSTSTAGSDFFLLSVSANNNNGVYTKNPNGYGFGAGADVYVRWPFTLASNLPKTNQFLTFFPNTTISAYNPGQYSQNNSSTQGRTQNYNPSSSLSSAVVSYANSPGANLSDPNFAAALRTLNFQSAPWLASQTMSVTTPTRK
jgi:hypothetical protein